jgi:pimeloyl-ACP methyl ester carboxylesterase
MTETTEYLLRPGGEQMAFRRLEGRGPTVLWVGGFRADMSGNKAQALASWAAARRQAFVRFDYFAHGASSGDFTHGTVTRWREDALAAIDELTQGPLILVGSSMGGWLSCLAAMARPQRVAGLVLVAPAPDFTETLMKPSLPPEAIQVLAEQGVWMTLPMGGEGGYPITRALLEDGARWSILPGPVPIRAPVRILQGGRDTAVPWTQVLELANALEGFDVVFSLIKDGEHRLSRPQDLQRLIEAVEELVGPS